MVPSRIRSQDCIHSQMWPNRIFSSLLEAIMVVKPIDLVERTIGLDNWALYWYSMLIETLNGEREDFWIMGWDNCTQMDTVNEAHWEAENNMLNVDTMHLKIEKILLHFLCKRNIFFQNYLIYIHAKTIMN